MKMKFLCLGYFDRERMDARPKEEIDAVMSECPSYLETLYETGAVYLDAGLGAESRHVRRAGGKLRVTDGPFIESKEMIGSAFLIEAENLEEAVRIASLHPAVQVETGEAFSWRLEIRPVDYFKRMEPEAER